MPKYRIVKEASWEGDGYWVERKGLLWGWNWVAYRIDFERALMCVEQLVAKDLVKPRPRKVVWP